MAQHLRSLTDCSFRVSSPSTHMAAHSYLHLLFQRIQHPHTNVHSDKTPMHIKYKKKVFFFLKEMNINDHTGADAQLSRMSLKFDVTIVF